MTVNKEGFWHSKNERYLPKPIGQEKKWKGREEFLTTLSIVESLASDTTYKGSSICRICGQENGSREYVHTFMRSTWCWPEGYRHYAEAHNVRPSRAFQEFILAAAASRVVLKEKK